MSVPLYHTLKKKNATLELRVQLQVSQMLAKGKSNSTEGKRGGAASRSDSSDKKTHGPTGWQWSKGQTHSVRKTWENYGSHGKVKVWNEIQ